MAYELVHAAAVSAVCWTSDSSFVSASYDRTAKAVSVASSPWHTETTLRGHKEKITSCVVNPSQSFEVATASRDHTIKLWNIVTGKLVTTLREHTEPVTGLSYSPDGTKLVSCSLDGRLLVWHVEQGTVLATLKSHAAGVGAVCYAPKGRLIVSGDDDGVINLWHSSTGEQLKSLTGHTLAVTQLCFLPCASVFFSSSSDMSIICWDAKTGDILRTLRNHSEAVLGLAVSPCGWHLASASAAGEVFVWDIHNGTILKDYHNAHPLSSCAFSPDNQSLLVGSHSGSVLIYAHHSDPALKTAPPAGVTRALENATPEVVNGSSPVSAASSCAPSPPRPRASLSPEKTATPRSRSPSASPLLRRATLQRLVNNAASQPGTSSPRASFSSSGTNSPSQVRSPEAQLTREKLRNEQLQTEIQRQADQLAAAREEIDTLRTEVKTVSRSRSNSNASDYVQMVPQLRWKIETSQLKLGTSLMSNPSNVLTKATWLGAPVLVKKFREPIRSMTEFQIWKEVASMRCTLGHPNLLHFYGASLAVDEHPMLVLEPTMASWGELALAELSFTLREAIDMVADLARGIAYLHERGLSHTRITVYNVFAMHNLQSKLDGAGEADAVYKTFPNPPAGDKTYSAPETKADDGDVDWFKADCYSFAIVVSDLLLGLSTSPTVAPTKRIESIPFEAIQRACSRCADPVPSDRMGMTDILEAFRSLSESGRYAEYEACAPRRRVSRNARNDVMLV